MTPRDGVLQVLRDDGGPLHWTVVQDRALRGGAIDPFVVPDVRRAVHDALRQLVDEGLVERAGTGVYRAV